MTFQKFMVVDYKKYRIYTVSFDQRLRLDGPGFRLPVELPDGIPLISPRLRQAVIDAIKKEREFKLKRKLGEV